MSRHTEIMIYRRVYDFLSRRGRCFPEDINRLITNRALRNLSVSEIRRSFAELLRSAYLCDIIHMHERNVFRGVYEYVEMAYREAEAHGQGLNVNLGPLREDFERFQSDRNEGVWALGGARESSFIRCLEEVEAANPPEEDLWESLGDVRQSSLIRCVDEVEALHRNVDVHMDTDEQELVRSASGLSLEPSQGRIAGEGDPAIPDQDLDSTLEMENDEQEEDNPGSPREAAGVQIGGNRGHIAEAEEENEVGESKLIIRSEVRRVFDNFHARGSEIILRIRPPPGDRNPIEWLDEAFEELHRLLVSGCEMTDYIGITFRANSLTQGPAGMSVRLVANFDSVDLIDLVNRVTQSAAEFRIDDSFIITAHVISAPVGRGRVAKRLKLDDVSNRSIVNIVNTDTLCLPRALVVAKAYTERGNVRIGELHERWNKVRRPDGKLQRELAQQLAVAAGVVIPPAGCGIAELRSFQQYLARERIAIVVYDIRTFGSGVPPFFNGQHFFEDDDEPPQYTFYLLHDNRNCHYDVILNLAAAAGQRNFCIPCGKAYRRIIEHRCVERCPRCLSRPPCQDEEVRCDDCRRFFYGLDCLLKHKQESSYSPRASVCDTLKNCPRCRKAVNLSVDKNHVCGISYCKICKVKRPDNHRCFIAPVKKYFKDSPEKNIVFIFYDFETQQNVEVIGAPGVNVHVPNLCVSQQRCTLCINNDNVDCENCIADRVRVFRTNPVESFVEYVFKSRKAIGKVICIAHNAKGFDAQFILSYLVENHCTKPPELILNGSSIIMMKVDSVKFIDSLNYFHMPLSALPKAFGLGEDIFKGVFPHLFNKPDNEQYVGPLPDLEYYSPDTMSSNNRAEFIHWYNEARQNDYIFDFRKELLEYCQSDVDILRRACTAFRQIFMSSGDVCPFAEATTIASACNRVYRKQFLAADTIGVIPRGGYRRADNQSEVAIQWLLWCEHQLNTAIIHAGRGREYRLLDGSLVDGYLEKPDGTRNVFQFHGCFFHGCNRCYRVKREKMYAGSTFDERFQRTRETSHRIESLGYILHEMWECDFNRMKADNEELSNFLNTHRLLSSLPLNPRDAFFGGRTGNTRTYCEVTGQQKIHYVDVCSLYPFISKTGRFPIGHPKVYTEDTCSEITGPDNCLDRVEGLVRCTVLPPRTLYHPVLPIRMHGRLMFALCRQCCTEMRQGVCTHENEEDRVFEGTWVSCELVKAVQMGYKIMTIHEIWQYDVVQYDPSTLSGGLFEGYVNLWLQIKQEASGWPRNCVSEAEKQHYLQTYRDAEGVELRAERIEKNPGLRSVAKLCLNSFWGKFGQRENLPKTEAVRTRERLLELLANPTIVVQNVVFVNESVLYVCWESTQETIEVNPLTSVSIAAYTTAQARLKLYSYLEQLNHRVLYYDTDSCIYLSSGAEGEYHPPLGSLLGDLTDELEGYGAGSYIKRFVSGGPKFYGYIVQTPDDREVQVCKVKGISLNYTNSSKINFDSIRDLIATPGNSIKIDFRSIKRTKLHQVVTAPERKTCKPVLVKRWRWGEWDSLPYGYRME